MAYLTSDLNNIRGYEMVTHSASGELIRHYLTNAYSFKVVKDSLMNVYKVLSDAVYEVDIESDLQALNLAMFGPTIRHYIYIIMKKFAEAAGIYLGVELAAIRLAHFGRDMREPLYNALIKLGADSEDIDPYKPTTANDYIYNIMSDEVTLVYYIGQPYEFIRIPATLNVEGTNYPVKYLAETLFNENTNIKGIKVPESVEVIS